MAARWIVGVDEAGRGALAGPVAVGAVKVPRDFDWNLIGDVRDSKQLSTKKREEVFACAHALKEKGLLEYVVSFSSATMIDQIGITRAVLSAVDACIEKICSSHVDVFIKLDGLLRAPELFAQETIVRGDQTEKEISLASIMAKVTRDHYMVELAKEYPVYGFEIHKGYGTLLHRNMIREHKISDVHRAYFTKNIKHGIMEVE